MTCRKKGKVLTMTKKTTLGKVTNELASTLDNQEGVSMEELENLCNSNSFGKVGKLITDAVDKQEGIPMDVLEALGDSREPKEIYMDFSKKISKLQGELKDANKKICELQNEIDSHNDLICKKNEEWTSNAKTANECLVEFKNLLSIVNAFNRLDSMLAVKLPGCAHEHVFNQIINEYKGIRATMKELVKDLKAQYKAILNMPSPANARIDRVKAHELSRICAERDRFDKVASYMRYNMSILYAIGYTDDDKQ